MNINENNDNLTVNQNEKIDEIKETLEETSHTKEELSSSLELDKISIKRKLARAKNVEDRVKLFAKVSDKF
jgi:ribonuclease PH